MSIRPHLWWLSIALAVLCLDQITKQIADNALSYGDPISWLPMLDWKLAYNSGAAFSMLSQAGGWQRWFFTGLSLVICTVIVVWLSRIANQERLTAVAMALVLGGAIGNLIDRLIFGYVIDFIDFYYPSNGECIILFYPGLGGSCHWPTFNVADSAICIGAVLLLISSFQQRRSAG